MDEIYNFKFFLHIDVQASPQDRTWERTWNSPQSFDVCRDSEI